MYRRPLALTAFAVLLALVGWLGVAESRRRVGAPDERSWEPTPHAAGTAEPIATLRDTSDTPRTPFDSAPPLDIELELMTPYGAVKRALLVLEGTGPTGPFVEQVEWSAESPRLRHLAPRLTLTAYAGVLINDGGAGVGARGASEGVELTSVDSNGTTVQIQMRRLPWVTLRVTYEDATRPEMWAAIVPKRAFVPAQPESAFELAVTRMDAIPDPAPKKNAKERRFGVTGLAPGPYVLGIGRPGEPPVSFGHVVLGAGGGGASLRLPLALPAERIRVRCTTPDAARFDRIVSFFHRSPGTSGPIPAILGADGWHWIDRESFLGRKREGRPRRARKGPITLEARVKGFGARAIEIAADEDDYAIQFKEPAILDVVFVGSTAEMLDVSVNPLEWNPVQGDMHYSATDMRARVFVQPGRYRVTASQSTSTGGVSSLGAIEIGTLDIDLVPGPNAVEFAVPQTHGLSIETAGLQWNGTVGLRLVDADTQLLFGHVDRNGRAQFSGLPAGRYVLSAGKGKSTLEVTVPCGVVTYDVREVDDGER